ncbi:ABC transporter substrate-binding protein [Microlunatus elymi]|uniref:ABC transporter substrate-binding protein n=1 Tax=Microlunatus elymi TaxID=2596828 RepID=A0A516PTT4_9ACTN|nr:ABC transporter substrate-binding protein [Microlunatus elymi]QDP94530.1 ABC transporter substrate-binding protein [Microlunatus elymi]
MSVRSRRAVLAAMLVSAVTVVAGCGSGGGNPLSGNSASPSAGGGSSEIVVGSANFTENQVLAELYAQAIQAKGVKASTHLDIGSRELYIRALKDGSISVVPEYTGNLLQYLDPKTTATTAAEVDEQLPKAAQKQGFDVLDTTKAVDQDCYVVTKATADKYQLKTIGDLSKVPNLTVGGPTELQDRPYGPPGLEGIYKLKVAKFQAYDSPAIKVKDLKDGKITTADFFTTDAAIADNGFVKLEDPQSMILPQNVIPLVRADVKKNTKAVDAMNAVGAQLTTEDLTALIKKVDVEHQTTADVAKAWLSSKGLS